MSEPSVFIIIVNWKNWQDTLECLESLRGIDNDNFKTIVVDNCSENESFEKISIWCEEKGRFSTIKTESNLGFAGGCNIGIRHALSKKADYILLLNAVKMKTARRMDLYFFTNKANLIPTPFNNNNLLNGKKQKALTIH